MLLHIDKVAGISQLSLWTAPHKYPPSLTGTPIDSSAKQLAKGVARGHTAAEETGDGTGANGGHRRHAQGHTNAQQPEGRVLPSNMTAHDKAEGEWSQRSTIPHRDRHTMAPTSHHETQPHTVGQDRHFRATKAHRPNPNTYAVAGITAHTWPRRA